MLLDNNKTVLRILLKQLSVQSQILRLLTNNTMAKKRQEIMTILGEQFQVQEQILEAITEEDMS